MHLVTGGNFWSPSFPSGYWTILFISQKNYELLTSGTKSRAGKIWIFYSHQGCSYSASRLESQRNFTLIFEREKEPIHRTETTES